MPFIPDAGQGGVGIAAGLGGVGAMATSGALSGRAVASASAETQKLVDAAKSGGFTISEEGVKPLRDALDEMQDKLLHLRQSADRLSQAPQLGSHTYGVTVSEHDQKSAANEQGSALIVLDQFKEVLQQADEALQRAAGIYQEAEAQAQDNVSGA